jgi:hypothetical protein
MLSETEDQLPKNLEISQHPVPKSDKDDDLENNEDDPIDE